MPTSGGVGLRQALCFGSSVNDHYAFSQKVFIRGTDHANQIGARYVQTNDNGNYATDIEVTLSHTAFAALMALLGTGKDVGMSFDLPDPKADGQWHPLWNVYFHTSEAPFETFREQG